MVRVVEEHASPPVLLHDVILTTSSFFTGRNPFPDVKTHICLDQRVLVLSADRPLKMKSL